MTEPYGIQCNYCLSRLTTKCPKCGNVVCNKCVRNFYYACKKCQTEWNANEEGEAFYTSRRANAALKEFTDNKKLGKINEIDGMQKPSFWKFGARKRFNKAINKRESKLFNDALSASSFFTTIRGDSLAQESKDALVKRSSALAMPPGNISEVLSKLATAKRLFGTAMINLSGISEFSEDLAEMYNSANTLNETLDSLLSTYKAKHEDELKSQEESIKAKARNLPSIKDNNENSMPEDSFWTELAKNKEKILEANEEKLKEDDKVLLVEAGIDPYHQIDRCDDCQHKFTEEEVQQEKFVRTCSRIAYLTLCEECYKKAGNNVR